MRTIYIGPFVCHLYLHPVNFENFGLQTQEKWRHSSNLIKIAVKRNRMQYMFLLSGFSPNKRISFTRFPLFVSFHYAPPPREKECYWFIFIHLKDVWLFCQSIDLFKYISTLFIGSYYQNPHSANQQL